MTINKKLLGENSFFQITLITVILFIALYFLSRFHYLLFHSIAEVFSIVIACAVFMISWNVRKKIENAYLVYLGIAYLFIAVIDLFHTLSYAGMSIFTDYDYYANQLWIGARYLESISLLTFFILSGSKVKISYNSVFISYLCLSLGILLSVFYWKVFPVCFIEGQGQTTFKLVSEYIISAILILSLLILNHKKNQFDDTIYRLLKWIIVLTVLGELVFTVYISNYGFSNLVGHYLKIASFYLVYKAIIKTGLERPFDLIFRELKQKEEKLEKANVNLSKEVKERILAEEKITIAYKEKEILLNEIHHRVKNNLAVVSGLLHLQAGSIKDQEAKNILIDSQNRVKSISAIHDTLYQSEDFSAIDLNAYLSKLSKTVVQSFTLDNKINLKIEVDNIMIGVKHASPLGLIVNELITNSFKYAFPGDQTGEITIKLNMLNENDVALIVSDNGIGMPQDFDWEQTKSLGLKLVKMLAESQFGGSIDLENRNGTKFTIKFKIEN